MLCETIDLQEFFRAVDFSSLVPCFFQSSYGPTSVDNGNLGWFWIWSFTKFTWICQNRHVIIFSDQVDQQMQGSPNVSRSPDFFKSAMKTVANSCHRWLPG